jgi:hypothetical protein
MLEIRAKFPKLALALTFGGLHPTFVPILFPVKQAAVPAWMSGERKNTYFFYRNFSPKFKITL